MMKLGIGLGGMSWGSDNRTASRTFGGTVRNNKFMSGSTGYFGYAISVAGHMNAVISGNDASGAQFGGKASSSCIPVPAVPASQAFVYDRYTSVGSQMQDNFVDADLVFLICQEPGSVVSKGVVKAATGMMIAGKEAAGDVVDSVASSAIDPSSAVTTTSPASASTNATSVLDRLFDLVQTVAHTVVPRSTKSRINWRERMSLKNAAKSASAAAAKTTGIRQVRFLLPLALPLGVAESDSLLVLPADLEPARCLGHDPLDHPGRRLCPRRARCCPRRALDARRSARQPVRPPREDAAPRLEASRARAFGCIG